MSEASKRVRKASEKILDKNNIGELQLSSHQNARSKEHLRKKAFSSHTGDQSNFSTHAPQLSAHRSLTVPDSNSALAAQKRKAPESDPVEILSGDEENLEAPRGM
jgi:hypothetical protein